MKELALAVLVALATPAVAVVTTTSSRSDQTGNGTTKVMEPTLDVKAFGCVGDGVADDTACLRAAIAAASRPSIDAGDWGLGEGGVVYLPRGVYRITAPLAWTADGVWLVGEGASNTSSIEVDLASNPATTDAIQIGSVVSNGRRSGLKNLSIYSKTIGKCRDLVAIDGTTWWRLENVKLHRAGRHGLTVGGTLDGTAMDVVTSENGGSGVFIKSDSSGTGHTTTDFYHLYSSWNREHGVVLEKAHLVNFFGPIIEFNGRAGDATRGDGIRMGTTVDAQMEINLHGPYFEANRGWDIKGGVAATGSNAHLVNLFGFFAQSSSQGEIKEPGYGFFHGTRTNGAFVGGRLSGYTVADGFKTYSFDGTCQISMLGPQGNINDTNAPIYRDIVEWAPLTAYLQNDVRQNQGKEYVCITAGTSAASGGPVTTAADIPDGTAHWAYRGIALNSYGRGMIEWVNADGDKVLYGRYMARAGGPGTDASIALRRFASTTTGPSNGTATAGDVAFNRFAGFGRPIGWAATVAGTPGTWIPLGFIPSVSGNFGDTNQTLTSPIEPIVRWATTLTANRTVTLSTTGALRGQTVRVVRTGLGAFTLDVGPGLKTIPKSTAAFVDVAFDGSAWVLTGYGAL